MKVYFNQMDIVDRDSQGDPEHVDTELLYQIGKVVFIYSQRYGDFTGTTSSPHVEEDWKEISANDIISKEGLIKSVFEQ